MMCFTWFFVKIVFLYNIGYFKCEAKDQRDISEHCRRQVYPSVFLGAHVMDANSQILHFSYLDEPYSCYISLRAESGNFIVLVFQVDDTVYSCPLGSNSVVRVYEMGETFGGYWGPMPKHYSRGDYTEKYHTLKRPSTDDVIIEAEQYSASDIKNDYKSKETTKSRNRIPTGATNVLFDNVPLVRLSGKLVPSDEVVPQDSMELDESYDYKEIVPNPRIKGVSSKIVPIVRLSLVQPPGRKGMEIGNSSLVGYTDYNDVNNTKDAGPRFQLEYNLGDITLDNRFNKLMKFRKKQRPLFAPRATSHSKLKSSNVLWSHIEALLKNVSTEAPYAAYEKEKFSALVEKDWQQNYSIYLAPNLSSLTNRTVGFNNALQKKSSALHLTSVNTTSMETLSTLMHNKLQVNTTSEIMKEHNNASTKQDASFLSETLSVFSNTETTLSLNVNTKEPETTHTMPISSTTEQFVLMATTTSILTTKVAKLMTTALQSLADIASSTTVKLFGTTVTESRQFENDPKSLNFRSNLINTRNNSDQKASISGSIISSAILPKKIMVGSTVDRESWENLVQVAPKIADILSDQHIVTKPLEKMERNNRRMHISTKGKSKRKKRSIQAIPIEYARPHNMTIDKDMATTLGTMYPFRDMLDFANLIELQDDNLFGHVDLRDISALVGKKVFDLCEAIEEKPQKLRYVRLYNTSRLVISITNFAWKRLTIIATPVRTVTTNRIRCDSSSIECQISGARVCVDNLNACDNVPNCGAHDIYDEDRLLCGSQTGVQHSVILAAFTFLAVIMTFFYVVYYWLRRCVPRVSDAFFIYTDGTENFLHLNSIMKSPLLQTEEGLTKTADYQNFEGDLDVAFSTKTKTTGFFKKITKLFKRKKEIDLPDSFNNILLRRMFSFPEMEINRMINRETVEQSVQTGESLEIKFIDELTNKKRSSLIDESCIANSVSEQIGHFDIFTFKDEEKVMGRTLQDSELNMLKFFKDARLSSSWNNEYEESLALAMVSSSVPSTSITSEEQEITTTVYDRSDPLVAVKAADVLKYDTSKMRPSMLGTISEEAEPTPGPSGTFGKRLRFDETLTKISSGHDDDDSIDIESRIQRESSETTSSGMDFIRFWGKKSHNKKKSSSNK